MKIISLEEHVSTKAIQESSGLSADKAHNDYLRKALVRLLDTGEGRLADMDAAGIDVQVLSLAPVGLDNVAPASLTSLTREANDTIFAATQRHPTRFAGFANLGLSEPEKAALELERCMNKLGFKGALINGTTDGRFLDDERFTPVLATAERLGAPIYLHPAPPPRVVKEAYFAGLPGQSGASLSMAGWGWHAETGLHVLRLILSGVFDRFPKLKMIIGHMGENLPFSLDRAQSVLHRDAGHLKKSIADYFHHHFWVTISGYFTTAPLVCALSVVGVDRIMFSVDYPFAENAVARAFLDNMPVSLEDRIKIAGTNAERLLKL